MSILIRDEIKNFFAAALECSFYVSPTEPGLSYEELVEAGRQAGFAPGEITDGINAVVTRTFGRQNPRFLPNPNAHPHWHLFLHPEEPEFRNVDAFRFLWSQLYENGRQNGIGAIRLERSVLLAKAERDGFKRLDVEVALAIFIFTGQLKEDNGVIKPVHAHGFPGDPAQTLDTMGHWPPARREDRRKAYPIVKDITDRRADGRPAAVEPLDAFTNELKNLGYGAFRLWWQQTVAEMRLADTQIMPVSVTVLAAALVEGVLTFVVKHARSSSLAVFRSNDFDGEPRAWKIEKLVASAASGGDAAILDMPTKIRAEGLIQTRQRIHAGRMLSDFPQGVPDLKPEQARDAIATAELVVRKVIEWLARHPASST